MTAAEAVTFDDWLDGRRPLHLSTNIGTDRAAFQGWRNFKEAFAPELIGQAYEETSRALGRPVTSCIDPFGGSGTTALACQFLGVSPTTIEVNPFLADLIEAKLSSYDADQLVADFSEVIKCRYREYAEPFPGAPATFVEPGVSNRYIFSRPVASRIASIRAAIRKVADPANRRLMLVLLGAISLSISNVVVSGKGRRYRRDWEKRQPGPDAVDAAFSHAVIKAIYEIRRYENRLGKGYQVLRGDARELIPTNAGYDLTVFSPPYPNSFDYTDVYNVELWVCGYLGSSAENRELRLSTLRSHVQIKRSFDAPVLESSTLERVASELDGVRAKLWDQDIPAMVSAYFADMNVILTKLYGGLIPGGRAYMVVGDSQYAGVLVPVAQILNELALAGGFEVAGEEPFRSMRASPQQGGREQLAETLITLVRV
ncbi:hypothetical protein [Rhodovarius lipocyclicus]|jgi:hypothetical protein|uniref:hypothetical protein n=1 Tax=Rhodovarius lipocyclicus TaxID=268410 RepID=UPI00135B39BE|nr:hypothetical protein [Rhodovarius lipocyclicus]